MTMHKIGRAWAKTFADCLQSFCCVEKLTLTIICDLILAWICIFVSALLQSSGLDGKWCDSKKSSAKKMQNRSSKKNMVLVLIFCCFLCSNSLFKQGYVYLGWYQSPLKTYEGSLQKAFVDAPWQWVKTAKMPEQNNNCNLALGFSHAVFFFQAEIRGGGRW